MNIKKMNINGKEERVTVIEDHIDIHAFSPFGEVVKSSNGSVVVKDESGEFYFVPKKYVIADMSKGDDVQLSTVKDDAGYLLNIENFSTDDFKSQLYK